MMLEILILLVGMFFSLMKFRDVLILLEMKKFKVSDMTILEASIDTYTQPEVYVVSNYFIPKIKYEYIIDGEKYTSDIVFPNRKRIMFGFEGAAKDLLDSISNNGVVYYSPDNPTNSFLARNLLNKSIIIESIIFFIYIFVCVFVFLLV